MTRKRIRLNAFDMSCVGHQSPGVWSHPEDQAHRYTDLEYWTDLARLLERGCFDGLFLADVVGIDDVYTGSKDPAVRTGSQVPVTDPLYAISAMAAVTEHLGFAATVSLTYEQPYTLARKLTTLDHLTKGRVGWNIVTSYLDSAARNLGIGEQTRHDDRYEIAEEFLEVSYKLWESSWEDGAVVADKKSGVYADPDKVHDIAHHGKHFDVPGAFLSEPSTQRTPVLYQAGASARGRAFAARHAEAVFLIGQTPEMVRAHVDDIREQAARQGRDPASVKIFPLITPIVAETDEQAYAKYREYRNHADRDGALTLFGGWSGIDVSGFAGDEPLEHQESNAIRTVVENFTRADPHRTWTRACLLGMGARGCSRSPSHVDAGRGRRLPRLGRYGTGDGWLGGAGRRRIGTMDVRSRC